MTEYLVFFGRRGDKSIVWRPEENPLGVYSGKDGTDACQQAAAYHGVMGAFFAVEGTFWGVTPADAPKQFGQQPRLDEQLSRLIDRVEQRLALDAG
ncbi:MAG: hypothetical protein KGL39_32185, partial [Patescibacteria group bacterium]|nr:hypothetical protein [Patescibacteria group bacterium]